MQRNSGQLTGLTIGITGAGAGIGRACALAYAREGARVSVCDLDGGAAEIVADQIRDAGGIAEARRLDVTSRQEVEITIANIENVFGALDCWHSNAGVSSMNRFVDLSDHDWNVNMRVNAYGTFVCGQVVARAMISRRRGRILNTASMAAKAGNAPFLAHYVASKFAVMGLTQSMAAELAPFGITVNCVCPGFVATAMQQRELVWEAELRDIAPVDVLEQWIKQTPLGRVETAEDVADVCVFLLSDSARFVTGESLSVNGGARMD